MPLSPQSFGYQVEALACQYLENRGLHLITRNYRCPTGEIDLIMSDHDQVVFIEVRHRGSLQFGSALDSITPAKTRKIVKTAQHFLQSRNWLDKVGCRFDIVTSQLLAGRQQIDWLKNAYTAD